MKEKGKTIHFAPGWCSRLCQNAGNQVCVEDCALKRDCSWFELKPDLKLEDMPRFPMEEFATELNPKERMIIVAVYLSEIMNVLQGVENERPVIDRARSRQVLAHLQIAAISANSTAENTPCPDDGKTDSDSGKRPD